MTRENITELCPLNRKVCYRHRKRALTAAARLAAGRHSKLLRVYKCERCRKWHLTSQEAT